MEINPVFPSAVDDIVVKEITTGYFISRSFLIFSRYAQHVYAHQPKGEHLFSVCDLITTCPAQDRDHCVSVYTARQLVKEEEEEEEEEELVVTWEFMAKYRSHYEEIESKTMSSCSDFSSSLCTCVWVA